MAAMRDNIELRQRLPRTNYALPTDLASDAHSSLSEPPQNAYTPYQSASSMTDQGDMQHFEPLIARESIYNNDHDSIARLNPSPGSTSRLTLRDIMPGEINGDNQQRIEQRLKPPFNSEKVPKHIIETTWRRFFRGWIVHIPAIITTVFVILLGYFRVYWYPQEGPFVINQRVKPDYIANILQFAAKLHEIMIVMSLSAIGLSLFRRCLITKGVRLGFLTGGYRVGDLPYLFTNAFRRQNIDGSRPWDVVLCGYLVFATVMSTIVGPASAVLLVPTLGWFHLSTDKAFDAVRLPMVYFNTTQEAWPTHLQSWAFETKRCKYLSSTLLHQYLCPAAGSWNILDWVQDFGANDLSNNVTFQSASSDIRRYLNFTEIANTTLSTTSPHFLMESIALFQNLIATADVGWISKETRYRLTTDRPGYYHPFVQSTCTTYINDSLGETALEIHYPLGLNCFGDRECLQLQDNPPVFTGLDSTKMEENVTIFDFQTHYDNSSIVFTSGAIRGDNITDNFYLCTLLASWIPSNFSYDPTVNQFLQVNHEGDQTIEGIYNEPSLDMRVVQFDKAWFNISNPYWSSSSNDTSLATIIDSLFIVRAYNGTQSNFLNIFNQTNDISTEAALARVFGAYLAESLARTSLGFETYVTINKTDNEYAFFSLMEQHGYSGGIYHLVKVNSTHSNETFQGKTRLINTTIAEIAEDFQESLQIGFNVERYGYGSGQTSHTLIFAQWMMYIYFTTVAVYALAIGIGYVLEALDIELRGKPVRVFSIRPWSDMQDLIVLALKTRATSDEGLVDAGAGVTSHDIWKKIVKARTDDADNVQLILGEDEHTKDLDLKGRVRYY